MSLTHTHTQALCMTCSRLMEGLLSGDYSSPTITAGPAVLSVIRDFEILLQVNIFQWEPQVQGGGGRGGAYCPSLGNKYAVWGVSNYLAALCIL